MSWHLPMAIAWILIVGNFILALINGVLLRKAKRLNRELGEVLALWKARIDATAGGG